MTEYREMGFLPEAVRNYLLRLGWSHGDEEIISTEQAIALFDLGAVGRSPARFDLAKLTSLNAHYLRERPDERTRRAAAAASCRLGLDPDAEQAATAGAGHAGAEAARAHPGRAGAVGRVLRPAAAAPVRREGAARLLDERPERPLASLDAPLAAAGLERGRPGGRCRAQAETQGIGFGKLAQPLRVALTGTTVSPGVFEVMRVLGRSEVLARIADAATGRNALAQQLQLRHGVPASQQGPRRSATVRTCADAAVAGGTGMSDQATAKAADLRRRQRGDSRFPVLQGTLGPDVVDVRKLYGETGMFTYDPGFTSTASCESKITFIDGDEGVLLHRGYPIEDLAEQLDFLEVCYLLLNGELPDGRAVRPSSSTTSPTTRCCTSSSTSFFRASAATPTRWRS